MTTENTSLIVRKPSGLEFTFAPDALLLKESALNTSALVGRVANAEQNAVAVNAQKELKRVMALFEKERKAAKEPLLEAGRSLDRAVASEMTELEKEFGRISSAVSEFQIAEQRRINEEQRLQQEELARIEREKKAELDRIAAIEREKQAELAKQAAEAKTAADRARIEREAAEAAEAAMKRAEAVQEAAAAQSYVESRPIATTRTDGQIVKTDWQITVTNPYELAKYHPDCVTITPRLSEIKAALNNGQAMKGIKAEKITKSSVRISPDRSNLIEV